MLGHFGYATLSPPDLSCPCSPGSSRSSGCGFAHPASVGRDDGDVAVPAVFEVVDEDGQRGEVVEGDVDESLDLSGVQASLHSLCVIGTYAAMRSRDSSLSMQKKI